MTNKLAPGFADTPSSWYNGAINAVVKAGLMRGYPDGSFRPNDKITRAEFAQLIMGLDKANSSVAPFADVKAHWGEKAINQAYGNKRIIGYPDGSFRPDASITRAEAVVITNNLFDREVDRLGLGETLENPEAMINFTDLYKTHWAYYELREASNTHEYARRSKFGVVENWLIIENSL